MNNSVSRSARSWRRTNPILRAGFVGTEEDTDKKKMGDGVTPWNALDYVGSEEAPGGGPQLFYFGVDSVEQLAYTYDGVAVSNPVLAINNGIILDEEGVPTLAEAGLYRLETTVQHSARGAGALVVIVTTTSGAESYECVVGGNGDPDVKYPPRVYAFPAETTFTVEVSGAFDDWDELGIVITVVKLLGA